MNRYFFGDRTFFFSFKGWENISFCRGGIGVDSSSWLELGFLH